MGAFLCVAQGSPETPWFLEMRLNCPENGDLGSEGQERPVVLVGKGEWLLLYVYKPGRCGDVLWVFKGCGLVQTGMVLWQLLLDHMSVGLIQAYSHTR